MVQSPDNTLVGYDQAITDAGGNVWSITADGMVAVNGVPDPTTANVTHLAYANDVVWQENTQNLWWSKSSPSDSWTPDHGTSVVPVPIPYVAGNNDLVVYGQPVTDASGNVWTITAGGQVSTNGVVDQTTANVTHLAYANGLIWQENTQDLWWSKASPAASWTPDYGTSVVPVPVPFRSNNMTILAAKAPTANGGLAQITDASDNIWTIVNGQVAVNGVVDPTTANVTQIAYIDGNIWQMNNEGLWWSKATPADSWSTGYGTPVNPITGTYFIANNPFDGAVIDVGVITVQEPAAPPSSVAEIITPGFQATGTAVGVSTTGALVRITGQSLLSDGATLTVLGAYRAPGPYYGAVENDGPLTVLGSVAHLGALSGTGSIYASDSSLDIQSATAGNTIAITSSHLTIGGQGGFGIGTGPAGGMSFLAPITMDDASTVTLADTQATSEVLRTAAGALAEVMLYNGTTEVADLTISGVSQIYAMQTTFGAGSAVLLSTTPSDQSLPISVLAA